MNETHSPTLPSIESALSQQQVQPQVPQHAYYQSANAYRYHQEHVREPYVQPPQERPWKPREVAVFLAVILAADLLLWKSFGGISFALFLVVAAAAAALSARIRRTPMRIALTVLLLLSVVARAALLPTAGTVTIGLALLFALVVQLRTREGASLEIAASAWRTFIAFPSRAWALSRGVSSVFRRVPLSSGLLLQVFVPLGLVTVFGGVFALANPLVGHYVGSAAAWVAARIVVPEALRIGFWCALVPLALLLVKPAVRLATKAPLVDRSQPAKSLSIRIATNSLVAVNVAFAAFLALDANYLWRGAPPPGMTTQTYAHEGAFWLTVALFLTTVVLGVLFRGALAFDGQAKLPRTFAWIWIGQNLLLAGSAFRRMTIHVQYSGLSSLRIFGYFGAALVLVGLGLVAMKLYGVKSARWLIARQLDAFAVAVVLFGVLPTHRLSAHVNVARIEAGELRPALHLFAQAKEDESADVLLPLLRHKDARIREGVAQLLLERDDASPVQAKSPWFESIASRNVSSAMHAHHDELLSILGKKDHGEVHQTLFKLMRAANEGQPLELLLSIPPATLRAEGAEGEMSRGQDIH